jgi:hypothetical protein
MGISLRLKFVLRRVMGRPPELVEGWVMDDGLRFGNVISAERSRVPELAEGGWVNDQ